MSKNIIESVHQQIGHFNGALFFKINNRLLIVDFGTPNFNDFGEWRISEMKLASKDYDPSGDTVELEPLDLFVPIEISDEEYLFLQTFFTVDEDTEYEERYTSTYKTSVNPHTYCQEPLLASFVNDGDTTELTHQIFKAGKPIDGEIFVEALFDKNVKTKEWVNKKNIMQDQGLYNLLIIMMDRIVNNLTKS